MKYLSTLVLILGMIASWKWSNSEAKVSVRLHHDIQMDLQQVIETAVKTQLPEVKEIQFHNVYSETLDSKKVKAYFSYTFVAPNESDETKTDIHGSAIIVQDSTNPQNWILQDIEVDNSIIEFQQGTIIKK